MSTMIELNELTEEERMIRDSARQFAAEQVTPLADELFETGRFPYEVIAGLAEIGFMGILIPEAYGGVGASTTAYVAAMEEMAKADVAIALTWQVHVLVSEVYAGFASEAQKEEWLPRMARGEILGGIAMTEPGAGSDLRAIRTTAVRDGDEWVIDGTKTFITNAGTDISDGLIVLARTGEDEKGRPLLSTFIVPRETPGLVLGQRLKKFGWKCMDTRELFLEGCRIPAENILGEEGKGLRHTLTGMDLGRIVFATASLGIAQACLEHSVAYAKTRVQFGQPIGKFQAIQFRLADLAARIFCVRHAIYAAAKKRDLGLECEVEASMAKLIACRLGVEAADTAFHVFGGYGFSVEYPIARYYADAKIMEIGEGTTEMQQMRIAKDLGL